MIRKYIEHTAVEGLKYFFNLDYTLLHHLVGIAGLSTLLCRIAFSHLSTELSCGLQTVSEDLQVLRELAHNHLRHLTVTDNGMADLLAGFRNILTIK